MNVIKNTAEDWTSYKFGILFKKENDFKNMGVGRIGYYLKRLSESTYIGEHQGEARPELCLEMRLNLIARYFSRGV